MPLCTLPLTATAAVDLVITELGVFGFDAGRLTLLELQPGATLEDVRARTAAAFVVGEGVDAAG